MTDAGKPRDAELQYLKVIESDLNDPYAHYYLAELYREWDPPRLGDAIAYYRKVIEVGPDTFVAEQSREQLVQLGVASPVAGTPGAGGTPVSLMEGESS